MLTMKVTRAVEWVHMPSRLRKGLDYPGNDERHYFYIVTWNITGVKNKKREPLSAKSITYEQFSSSKLEKETVYPHGRSMNTFVKIRDLASKKC